MTTRSNNATEENPDQSNKDRRKDEGQKTEMTNQTARYTENRIECPCHNYTALSKIVDVIQTADSTRHDSMIEWLNGGTDLEAIRQKRLLTCGKRFRCRYRYGTSFAILKAIRDACAPFQTTSIACKSNSATTSEGIIRTEISDIPGSKGYDQSFPPLPQQPGASNTMGKSSNRKNYHDGSTKNGNAMKESSSTTKIINTKEKKTKRRVRPQLINVSSSTLHNSSTQKDNVANIAPKRSTEQSDRDQKDASPTAENYTVMKQKLDAKKDVSDRQMETQLTPVKLSSPSCTSSSTPDLPNSMTAESIQNVMIDELNPSCQSTAEASNDVLQKTSRHLSCKISDTAIEQMNRLVDIYIALIKNMLVPSTPLEIHFILELLSIDSNGTTSNLCQHPQRNESNQALRKKAENETGPVLFFQPFFYDHERCVYFAQTVLTRYLKEVIVRLSPFLIKSLLKDNNFVRRCPKVAENLSSFLIDNTTTADCEPPTPESITGTHAIFSLPFEPDRDSRHNFRTPAEISMYQNREMTRDAFLSQLRIFITAKSKVFLPQQVDEVRETAQYESKKIIASISTHNVSWFAQFFCELLLQVGLAPLEEMDQELLQIVADDRDKLQKLHKRFFKKSPSRSPQTRVGFGPTPTTSGRRNERYRAHNNINSNEIRSSTIFQEALAYFPGYQEFFFIFLYSVNSYNFGMHLLHQMAKKISGMVSNHSISGLEKRILDLGLLARFLGFLIFSPNWHEKNIDFNKLKPCIHSMDYGLTLLESIGLPMSKLIQESWDGGYTLILIPWVTELLKMSKWDSISQSSIEFRQILANLRFVQSFASQSSNECRASGSNLQQVYFHIEAFLNEIFSLPKLTSLPNATLAQLIATNPLSLDNQKIRFSKVIIHASSPYMEDLCDMIVITKKPYRREMKSPSEKPKKLKPSIVSTTVGADAGSYIGSETPKGKVITPLSNANRRGSGVDDSLHGSKVHAKNKLTEGFFHQHRELKDICEFVVQQTLKTVSIDDIGIFVTKACEEFSIGIESKETEIEEMQVRALRLSQDYLRNKLANTLRKSLELLCRTDTQRGVIDIATKLSTDRGMTSSLVIVRDLISSSTKTILKQSGNMTVAQNLNGGKNKSDIDQATESATASIRNLTKKYSTFLDHDPDIKDIEEALDHVKFVTDSVLIPRESVLRDFFECVLGLDRVVESIVDRAVQSNTPESWVVLSTFFRLLQKLALVSGYWRTWINDMNGDDLFTMISNSNLSSSHEKKILLEKLNQYTLVGTRNSFNSDLIEPLKIQFD